MKVVTVVGARPQFIKAAVVSRALHKNPKVQEILVHTGQHYDDNMSAVFFSELDISTPDFSLGVGSGTHGAQTGRMLEAIEQILLREMPDWVLVYGDTNSTLAGALAAAKLHIPIAHVEAGPRAYNRLMPEEVNRVLTDHVSDLLFAPTAAAEQNLLAEGIPKTRIHLVGDVMFDAALYYGVRAEATSRILGEVGVKPKEYMLATVHRAETTDNPSKLKATIDGLMRVAVDYPVVLPLHPRTRKVLEQHGLLSTAEKVLRILAPVGYLDMAMLEKNARIVATDSGGVPKEAYFYGVPSVILRKEAVWVELVDMGWAVTVDPVCGGTIAGVIRSHLNARGCTQSLPYGDGKASERIVDLMAKNGGSSGDRQNNMDS